MLDFVPQAEPGSVDLATLGQDLELVVLYQDQQVLGRYQVHLEAQTVVVHQDNHYPVFTVL